MKKFVIYSGSAYQSHHSACHDRRLLKYLLSFLLCILSSCAFCQSSTEWLVVSSDSKRQILIKPEQLSKDEDDMCFWFQTIYLDKSQKYRGRTIHSCTALYCFNLQGEQYRSVRAVYHDSKGDVLYQTGNEYEWNEIIPGTYGETYVTGVRNLLSWYKQAEQDRIAAAERNINRYKTLYEEAEQAVSAENFNIAENRYMQADSILPSISEEDRQQLGTGLPFELSEKLTECAERRVAARQFKVRLHTADSLFKHDPEKSRQMYIEASRIKSSNYISQQISECDKKILLKSFRSKFAAAKIEFQSRLRTYQRQDSLIRLKLVQHEHFQNFYTDSVSRYNYQNPVIHERQIYFGRSANDMTYVDSDLNLQMEKCLKCFGDLDHFYSRIASLNEKQMSRVNKYIRRSNGKPFSFEEVLARALE